MALGTTVDCEDCCSLPLDRHQVGREENEAEAEGHQDCEDRWGQSDCQGPTVAYSEGGRVVG